MKRLVLGIAVAVTSLTPIVGMADDQQIAEYVKGRLLAEQQQGNLKGFNVDMRVEEGTVWFKGYVSNENQQMTILRAAQQAGHLGVVQVVDDIDVRTGVQPAQPVKVAPIGAAPIKAEPAKAEPAKAEPVVKQTSFQPQSTGAPVSFAPSSSFSTKAKDGSGLKAPISNATPAPISSFPASTFKPASAATTITPSAPIAPTAPAIATPVPTATAPVAPQVAYGNNEPLPFANCTDCGVGGVPGGAVAAGPAAVGGPSNLPGYAWPAYAAAPNYGAVSYPRQYSASAWPYIGPFYPYPQVPLGWRKVTLEWDDGFWHLDFKDK